MSARTENSVVIDAPLELTWRMTNDLEQWTDLFTEYKECTILEHAGDTFTFRLTTVPDESGTEWSWVSQRTLDADNHEVHAHRVETGPFEFMKLHWTYEPVPEGTLMTWHQEFAMKPTAPVDDAQMADRINHNSPIQMAGIKAKVEAAAAATRPPTPVPVGPCCAVPLDGQPVDSRRGGKLRVVLGPKTVGATSGFMGVLDLAPGERFAEHYHPFSEEFLFVAAGSIVADLDDVPTEVPAGSGVFVPKNVRHRLRNVGTEEARVVFQLGPLAPRPELGHVDTEGSS